jgi:hypothetical protein
MEKMKKPKEKLAQFASEAAVESTVEYFQRTYRTFRDTNKNFLDCQKLMGKRGNPLQFSLVALGE